MAIVCRALHRWWVPLITIAVSMLANADAPAREIGGKGACAIQKCLRPWAGRFAMSGIAGDCSAARCTDGFHDSDRSRAGADPRGDGARLDGHLTMQPGRGSRLRFDADEWGNCTDGDDDTDVPVRTWFRDMVRAMDVILAGRDVRSALIDTLSDFSRMYRRLRC